MVSRFTVALALWLPLLLCGCKDDRKTVAMDIFICNPNSHTADYDCGDGFVCYSAVQAVGSSMCVPACDPADAASCPEGVCTRAGECLTRCSVDDPAACPAGGGVLSCMRTDYSPKASPGPDGLCLPVAFSCDDESQPPKSCESAVFNYCTSEISNGQVRSPGLLTSGSICVQGRCSADGVGCEPGSACIQKVLPASIASSAPDVCSPNCVERKRADGVTVEECLPGFTCLDQAFPQSQSHVCAPGFAGWLCVESLGCGTGDCLSAWQQAGELFKGFDTCAPPCDDDNDCAPFQAGPAAQANPNAFTTFTCQHGHCRSFQSMFFAISCLDPGSQCQVDTDATCAVNPVSPPPSPVACPTLAMATSIAGSPAICELGCQDESQCAKLSGGSHLTYSCANGICLPSVPYATPCQHDASCMPGLTCQAPTGLPGAPNICTASCQSTADCTSNESLGNAFACLFGQCTPKTESGCPPPLPQPDVCLSGRMQGSLCVSPTGWACDSDSRCASGTCTMGRCS